MKPPRAERPRPLLDGIRWLFAPFFAWWGFMGVAPLLIYVLIGLLAVGLLVRMLALFLGK